MIDENLDLFLDDFGVAVSSGGITGRGILDMPGQVILDGAIVTTDYRLTVRTSVFGGLLYGAGVTVDDINYELRESLKIDDGQFTELMLSRLAPQSTAPGQDPRQFGLDDLSDVELSSPTAGEALKYDGTKWVDGIDEGTSYLHTQSTASAVWTIAHNLGFKPSVELFNAGSQEIDGDVLHLSDNVVQVTFNIPITGFARLN
ncbi:MAG: hypothetical protein ACO242_02245 [Candidatus Fonsibacter ubiquis]